MTDAEKKELFGLLVQVWDDLGGIQRLVGAMPANQSRGAVAHALLEAANSLGGLFRELR